MGAAVTIDHPGAEEQHVSSPPDTRRTSSGPVSADLPIVGAPGSQPVTARYVRPLAGREIRGLAWAGEHLLTLDTRSGRLALVDPATDDTRVVNDGRTAAFVGARGLAVGRGSVWFTSAGDLWCAPWGDAIDVAGPGDLRSVGPPGRVLALGDACGVALSGGQLYLVRATGAASRVEVRAAGAPEQEPLLVVEVPGVGATGICATADALWLSDDVEQTVYCLDPATLATRFSVVTPLEGPSAITAHRSAGAVADAVHVAYHEREPYLRDNPFVDPSWEVGYRDRAVVHPLRFWHDPQARIAWSTGHRIVMHYYVEVEPDADVVADHAAILADVHWRISLPIDSPRQRVLDVEPIGLPFERVEQADLAGRPQPVAVFRIPRLDQGTRLILGWRATLEVFGIKHQLGARDLADADPLDPAMAARYLVDDEDLDLGTPQVEAATAAAIGDEANPLVRAHRIRDHVYDLLEYEMGHADSPVGVLARGTGSCGEYVGTLLALMRTAGLACRVAGRYKCPYHPWSGAPLHPDFNHVWVDLFLPGHGWVPVESNPDDVVDGGPYPDRFFLGLPWRHVELGKDISFERVTYDPGADTGRRRRIAARRLSRNHIRFDVLGELAPGPRS